MVVASIVITTIVVFVLVDLLLRMTLTRVRDARVRKEREQALDIGLIGHVVPDGQALDKAKEIAATIGGAKPKKLRRIVDCSDLEDEQPSLFEELCAASITG